MKEIWREKPGKEIAGQGKASTYNARNAITEIGS
jgi:hypothetical protein